MRPRQLATFCAAVGALLLATRPAGAAGRELRGARPDARADARGARLQPQPRDTVTVVRVDTVRVHDTVTVERTLPAPPQRVDTVRLVAPRGRP